MSAGNIIARANALTGALFQAETTLAGAVANVESLSTDRERTGLARDLLKDLAGFRRTMVTGQVGVALTGALRQVFGEEYGAQVGDPDGTGTKAETTVMVTRGDYTAEVGENFGEALNNLAAYVYWLQLVWVEWATRGATRLAVIDEPFTNLNPRRFALAADLLAETARLGDGVQVVLATNHEGLIPADANVVTLAVVDPMEPGEV